MQPRNPTNEQYLYWHLPFIIGYKGGVFFLRCLSPPSFIRKNCDIYGTRWAGCLFLASPRGHKATVGTLVLPEGGQQTDTVKESQWPKRGWSISPIVSKGGGKTHKTSQS